MQDTLINCQYFKVTSKPNTICIWTKRDEDPSQDEQNDFQIGVIEYLVSCLGFDKDTFDVSHCTEDEGNDFVIYLQVHVTFIGDGITMAALQGYLS